MKRSIFLAEGVVTGRPAPADEDEVLEPLWITLSEAQRLLWEGEINDAKTIIALQFAAALTA